MTKIKKGDLLKFFVNSLTEEQTEILEKLSGRKLSKKDIEGKIARAFKKTISVASRKGKAKRLQGMVAEQIGLLLDEPVGKDMDIQPREMGQSGVDVRLSPRILRIFPWSIECKDEQTFNVEKAIRQAAANRLPDTNWLLFMQKTGQFKENQLPPVAILDAAVFFQMLQKIWPPKLRRRTNVLNSR